MTTTRPHALVSTDATHLAPSAAPSQDGPCILAIESSCDETAAAILDGTRSLRSNVVHSQIDIHAEFGGVVPELASRSHILMIDRVVQRALDEAAITLDDVAGIAVTQGPGLMGSLLVGLEYARALAWTRNLPLEPVHHLEGHLYAPFVGLAQGSDAPGWPFVALVVSGGHTALYHAKAPGLYEELGRTLDDAAGEAFDKVSKHVGLGYPGGAILDRLAQEGDPKGFRFPRPMLHSKDFHFSFSGIKTSVSHALEKEPETPTGQRLHDLAASFQRAVVEVLVHKTLKAARAVSVDRIVLSGGVASNSELRTTLQERAHAEGMTVVLPPPSLCTDNAAMIGAAAYARLFARIHANETFAQHDLSARPSWPLGKRSPLQPVRRRGVRRGPKS